MLEKAIDNCRAVVFVSTTLSRKLGDARKKELPYIKNKDIQNAPPEYKQHGYKLLPKKYKKARIEYVVEGYSQIKTANDSWINEFFDGFERATLPVEVAVQLNELFDSHTLIQDDLSVTRDDEEKKRWQAEADRTQAENERLKRQLEEKQKVLEAQSLAQRKTANTTNQEQSEYPTLSNYNKKEFDIEGTVLTNYIRKNKKGEVKIPQGVTRIDDFAFSECSGLTSITIPNSVTSIGDWAFSECSGLTSITIPDSVASIGEQAFYDCSRLTSITISNSVTLIGEGAFCGCSGLTSITIPYSVTSIGDDAFRDCSGLTSITVPNSVKSIGKDAFSYCSGLTSITIPNSVKSIGKDAFWGCSGLTSVTLPAKFRFAINKAFKREKKHIHFEFLK
ncbi:MAG: leucine-rich repeat protein [Clostridia bacterium]|nr:leucine-rich repeat protein [Clostridia bacterium]